MKKGSTPSAAAGIGIPGVLVQTGSPRSTEEEAGAAGGEL